MIRLTLLTSCLAMAFFGVASASDVLTVPGDAATLQAAVDAALPGDVLLVAPGQYSGTVTVDGKGLSLVADGLVTIPELRVKNVPAGQTFLLSGFTVDPTVFAPAGSAAYPLIASNNPGALRFQDCVLVGDQGFPGLAIFPVGAQDGGPGASFSSCADVALHACTLTGGDGANYSSTSSDKSPSAGATGLVLQDSRVVVDDCTVVGGAGGAWLVSAGSHAGSSIPRHGGHGLSASGLSVVSVVHTALTAGDGGENLPSSCFPFPYAGCYGGDGGDGLHLSGGDVVAVLRGVTASPGSGAVGQDADGSDGVPVSTEGDQLSTFPAQPRSMELASPLREGESAVLTLHGEPGDGLLLFAGLSPGSTLFPGYQGVFLLGDLAALPGLGLGVLPGSGTSTTPILIAELGPGFDVVELHLQAVFLDAGQALLGPARMATILDSSF